MKTTSQAQGIKHARYRRDQQFKRDYEKGESNEICILHIVKGTSVEAGNAKEEHDLISPDNAVINVSLRQVSSAGSRLLVCTPTRARRGIVTGGACNP